jgi:hypothetical protein
MQRYFVDHLADPVVLREAKDLARHSCHNTADLLARLALIDERELYLPAGYRSMHAWSMGELPFCDDSADKRIHAARVARRFPALFVAVAEGRLHLTAVGMLAPHLTPGNADELIALASRKSKRRLERLLAERFPRPATSAPMSVAPSYPHQPAPARVVVTTSGHSAQDDETPTAGSFALAAEPAPARVEQRAPHVRVTPLSADRLRLEGTIDHETDELLQEARELLGQAFRSLGYRGAELSRALAHCATRPDANWRSGCATHCAAWHHGRTGNHPSRALRLETGAAGVKYQGPFRPRSMRLREGSRRLGMPGAHHAQVRASTQRWRCAKGPG